MKVAINGFGRIGKGLLRAIYEGVRDGKFGQIEVVKINASGDVRTEAHLLKFDTTNGIFFADVSFEDGGSDNTYLKVNHDRIKFTSSKEVADLDWDGVDILFDCSGAFLSREKASIHLAKGAGKVILSSPVKTDDIKTIIYQVNDSILNANDKIISVGSCTTNCLAPVVKVLHETFTIKDGFATTVHAYTNDQNLLDNKHKDLRRARAANMSIIPTTSGVSSAITEIFPELAGRINGAAMRVPVNNVSIIDFKFLSEKKITKDSINESFMNAKQKLNKVLDVSNLPLVSVDYIKNEHSSIVDTLETCVVGNHFGRICAWYDNEWSFIIRMLDVACLIHNKQCVAGEVKLTHKDSIHLQGFIKFDNEPVDCDLMQKMDTIREICSALSFIRKENNIRVRIPLKSVIILYTKDFLAKVLNQNALEIIKDEINIREISTNYDDFSKFADIEVVLNFKNCGKKFGSNLQKIVNNKNNFENLKNGQIKILDFILDKEDYDFVYRAKNKSSKLKACCNSNILIVVDDSIDENIFTSTLVRDLIRSIQIERKSKSLKIDNKIDIEISTNIKDINITDDNIKTIKNETLCNNITFKTDNGLNLISMLDNYTENINNFIIKVLIKL